jgi:hypothetical protein
VCTGSTALLFMAPGVPLVVRHITNFANESACLTANNVRNVVTIHILQVLKMLSSLHIDIFRNSLFH